MISTNEVTVMENLKEEELHKEQLALIKRAENIGEKINDEQSYEMACLFVSDAKKYLKERVFETLNPLIKKLKDAHQAMCDERSRRAEPVEKFIDFYGNCVNRYLSEKENRQRIEQERIMAEQKKQAEESALSAATEASNAGEHERAEAILAQPLLLAPVILQDSPPKIAGVRKPKEVWEYEIFDLLALVKGIADGRVPIGVLDQEDIHKKLKPSIQMLQIENPYPGVRARKTIKQF